MGYIKALGYIGIGATDLDAWGEFASDVLGLQVTRGRDDQDVETLFLRMDERHHRIAVRAGDDELTYVGWEVPNELDFDAQVADLERQGVAVKEDAGLASLRGVQRLARFADPAGFQLELFFGAAVVASPFVSPTGVRFVTTDPAGNDLGVGHVVLQAPNTDEMIDFYLNVLGFKVSDYIVMKQYGISLTFTHVNPRHHSLAFGPAEPGSKPVLNHLMLEIDTLDGVGRALDRVREKKISLTAALGRHTNDGMLSFYMESPSGIGVEYGTEGKLIDDETWTVTAWDAAQLWGHDRSHTH